jgi:hypothetical protein
MSYQHSAFWVTILDGVGIVLCCLIIVYLIYNKIKYRQLIIDDRLKSPEGKFSTQVLCHLMKQLADQAFASISDSVDQQRQSFTQLIENQVMINSQYAGPKPAYFPFQSRIVDTYPDSAPKIVSDREAYAQVLNLATVGLTIRQISEQLNIPPAEIELFLKLNAYRQKKPSLRGKKILLK